MKLNFTVLLTLFVSISYAQPKTISQAIINTKTNIIAPEDEDVQNLQNQGGGMNFRNIMDGETLSTTYLKNGMVKTILKSDVGRSTIVRNNNTGITTTIIEMMGNKTGFYVSDSEQTELRRKTDSLMYSRKKQDTLAGTGGISHEDPKTEIIVTDEIKKIAGYTCKKAYVITTRIAGLKDTVVAWYSPEMKLQYVSSTGGLSGFGSQGSISGLDKVDGFVMRYEMNMRRNRRMEVEVTKIDTGKEIADKEFDLPKDIEIHPMKDMQRIFGGRGMPSN